RLGERVGDREVGDCGREQHRAVCLLAPEEAEDVRGLLRVGQLAQQTREPLGTTTVELTDIERAPAAEEDAAGRDPVGAEVDERADRSLPADGGRYQRLVDPVLE